VQQAASAAAWLAAAVAGKQGRQRAHRLLRTATCWLLLLLLLLLRLLLSWLWCWDAPAMSLAAAQGA